MRPELELVPFTEVECTPELGDTLVALVASIESSLRVEMPQVLPRYANRQKAQESVEGVQGVMRRNPGFVAYFVKYEGDIVGVVSCSHQRLRGPRRFFRLRPGEILAEGPLIAGWHGTVPGMESIMVRVLRRLATRLADNPAMRGHAWTIVRVGHVYVEQHIGARSNGFGGFEPREVDEFTKVDGLLRMRRRLYVACNDLT